MPTSNARWSARVVLTGGLLLKVDVGITVNVLYDWLGSRGGAIRCQRIRHHCMQVHIFASSRSHYVLAEAHAAARTQQNCSAGYQCFPQSLRETRKTVLNIRSFSICGNHCRMRTAWSNTGTWLALRVRANGIGATVPWQINRRITSSGSCAWSSNRFRDVMGVVYISVDGNWAADRAPCIGTSRLRQRDQIRTEEGALNSSMCCCTEQLMHAKGSVMCILQGTVKTAAAKNPSGS